MSLSKQAYEAIKHKIVTLELEPGSVIDESALRDELSLGRTPIREALQRLDRDKLVSIVPRRGMFVSEISMDDLPLLYESRTVLEAYIARVAAEKGTEVHWQQMQQVLDSVMDGANFAPADQLIDADRICHEIMFDAAAHPYLGETLVMLYAQSQRLWHKYLAQVADMRGAILEHVTILDALRKGDGERAAQLTEEHIRHFQATIRDAMMQEIMAI